MTAISKQDQGQPALGAVDLGRLRQALEARRRALCDADEALRVRLSAEESESATANAFVAGSEGARAAESDDEVVALLKHDEQALSEIELALKRMDQGIYGLCTECGDAIGLPRLEALPSAACCLDCQDRVEHRQRT